LPAGGSNALEVLDVPTAVSVMFFGPTPKFWRIRAVSAVEKIRGT
jgi:hypothetical protein